MRMKKLMKIGALLLFMVGLFTVQLDFKSTLIENDVGLCFIENDVGLCFIDNVDVQSIDNIDITYTKISPDYVLYSQLVSIQEGTQLKYPLIELQSNTTKISKDVFVYAGTIMNDYTVNRQLVNKLNNEKGCFTNAPDQSIITGLFRLEIGESLIQKT